MPYLQLKLVSLTVRFEGYIFENGPLPRTKDEDLSGTVAYSAYGGVSVDGSPEHPPHFWTFSVATNIIHQYQPTLPDQVRELWSEYDRIRRSGADPSMELEDTTEYFFESSPRTRALATGASVIATTTGIKYYPKYNALFERPPVFQIGEGFTIQLREGLIVSA